MPAPRSWDAARSGDPRRPLRRAVLPAQGREQRFTPAQKQARYRAGIRPGRTGVAPMAWTQPRNGLPEAVPYTWRDRSYPWAQAVNAHMEKVHGQPEPTCLCGRPVAWKDGRAIRCTGCGRTPADIAGGDG